MNKELRNRWVAALRSGDYLQGRNTLVAKKGDRYYFCCLGVLGVLMGGAVTIYEKDFDDYGISLEGSIFTQFLYYPKVPLPINIQKYLGDMNDDGASFETIANYIEAHF